MATDTSRDCYAILGVAPTADEATIWAVFKQAMDECLEGGLKASKFANQSFVEVE